MFSIRHRKVAVGEHAHTTFAQQGGH
jgi:hypothetical protein